MTSIAAGMEWNDVNLLHEELEMAAIGTPGPQTPSSSVADLHPVANVPPRWYTLCIICGTSGLLSCSDGKKTCLLVLAALLILITNYLKTLDVLAMDIVNYGRGHARRIKMAGHWEPWLQCTSCRIAWPRPHFLGEKAFIFAISMWNVVDCLKWGEWHRLNFMNTTHELRLKFIAYPDLWLDSKTIG